MEKQEALHQYFGHTAFRPGQESLIDAVLAGRDALGVMPTGGGKSMCYQIPALLLPGLTIVVSPLISLMKDQVAALQEAGVAAACINSTLSAEETRAVYAGVWQGAYKLLYVAPERLDAPGFAATAQGVAISLVAVDEAHCISQWGQDFRPSYLNIASFVQALPVRPPVAAFTATATAAVREDIIRLLQLQNPVTELTGFDRPNLYFEVRRPKSKLNATAALIEERPGKSGIVYCATRAGVEKVCAALNKQGIPATRYHAGLKAEERQKNQDAFQFDKKRVMVATNAFGMGIDKSNVSFVIHYNMPKNMEAYYQEAGRAGRDGEPADCILLFGAGDVTTARFLIENGGGEAVSEEQRELLRRQDYERLAAMTDYCKTTACLRGKLMDYFGQSHGETCGNCGNCRAEYVEKDVTRQAQMVLSCVKRVQAKLGYYVGQVLLLNVLRGSKDKRVQTLGLDALSTYGLLSGLSSAQLRDLCEYLVLAGCLRLNPAHSTLEPGPLAAEVLFHGRAVMMPVRTDAPEEEPTARRRGHAPAREETGLTAALKALRTRLAQEENVPAYIIFTNAALADMAEKAPHTMAEFLEVSGVGAAKAKRYGKQFLEAIAAYEAAQE